METLLKDISVILLILVFGITGCAAPATQTPAPEATEPTAVNPLSDIVLKMAERLNAGDLEGSLGYFADDSVTYFVGMPPTGMEIYRGKEGIRPVWEECIGSHFKMEVEIVSVVGDVVNARSKTWHDFTRQLGVAPNEFIETYVIKDGKIALYSSVLTEESLAKFKPALAAVMPPQPTATPSTDTPVSEINVVISEGTCSYEGMLTLKAGPVKVNVDATGESEKTYGLTFFTLDSNKDIVDLMAATPLSYPPSWAKMWTLWEMNYGTSQTNTLTVEKGPLYLVCWSKPPDLAIGNIGPFEVDGAPAATVTWEGNECSYKGPNPIPEGREMLVEWVAKDTDKPVYYFEALTLLEGKTREYLIENYGSAMAGSFYETAAAVEVPGGGRKSYSIRTTKGPIYIACFNDTASTGIHRFIGPLEVK